MNLFLHQYVECPSNIIGVSYSKIQVIQDFDNQTVSIIEPEAGAWPPGRREALIDRASMDYIGIDIGELLLSYRHDSLDSLYFPTSGMAHDLSYRFADDMLGASTDYQQIGGTGTLSGSRWPMAAQQ